MPHALVAGNWKMHGSLELVERYVETVERLHDKSALPAGQLVLLPPIAYLAVLGRAIRDRGLTRIVTLGGQDLHVAREGAFTGEISGEMLSDLGAEWVLVGHSERRAQAFETDELVAQKCAAALRCGLKPVVCVGETEPERDAGRAETVVARQLAAVLDD